MNGSEAQQTFFPLLYFFQFLVKQMKARGSLDESQREMAGGGEEVYNR